MIGKIFAILCLLSTIFAMATHRMAEVSYAIITGAAQAVTVSIGLLGALCFWSGILQLLHTLGWVERLSHLTAPVLRWLFPNTFAQGTGSAEITACLCANLLGLGNAATPLAIAAMEQMQRQNPTPDTVTEDMLMFTVLGTAPFGLFPTTVLALRSATGSTEPFAVLIPIWLCSVCTTCVAVLCAKIPFWVQKKCVKRSSKQSARFRQRNPL